MVQKSSQCHVNSYVLITLLRIVLAYASVRTYASER